MSFRTLALLAAVSLLGTTALAQQTEVPREQTLIAENPNGTIANPDWFNIWTPAGSRLRPSTVALQS